MQLSEAARVSLQAFTGQTMGLKAVRPPGRAGARVGAAERPIHTRPVTGKQTSHVPRLHSSRKLFPTAANDGEENGSSLKTTPTYVEL